MLLEEKKARYAMIGLVLALNAGLIASYMSSTFFLRSQINALNVDRFSREEMRLWLIDLRERNPSIDIPSPAR